MQAQDFEIENKQLRETLQEYNSEFAQVDIIILIILHNHCTSSPRVWRYWCYASVQYFDVYVW